MCSGTPTYILLALLIPQPPEEKDFKYLVFPQCCVCRQVKIWRAAISQWPKAARELVLQIFCFSREFFTVSQRSRHDWVHSGFPLVNHSTLVAFSFLPHFISPLEEFPGIAFQINLVQSLLLGKPTLGYSLLVPWEGESEACKQRGAVFSSLFLRG